MGPEYIRNETVIEQPIIEQPVVRQPVVANVLSPDVAVAGATVRSSYVRSFALDAWVASIAGLVITIIGLLAITRGGFDGSMDDPVVQVVGFNHTTLLGLIEAVAGIALLISGASQSRGGILFISAVIGIGAFVGAVQTESFVKSLALESSFAWLMLAVAVIVALTAALVPRSYRRSDIVQAV
jgi:hypothetical protein